MSKAVPGIYLFMIHDDTETTVYSNLHLLNQKSSSRQALTQSNFIKYSMSSKKKKTKKELRKEATKLANRIHRNISHANGIENPLQAAPSLAMFTTLDVNLRQPLNVKSGEKREEEPEVSQLNIKFYESPLPKYILDACIDLFKANMGKLYEQSSWGLDMKSKKEELTHETARYLIVTASGEEEILAFAHFRFEVDSDDQPTREVLYLYEIQISPVAQRNGLGKRIMQILETIGMQMKMRNVMLTVFKNNQDAIRFYEKLKYKVDEISPSKYGEEADYEIMSKCVHKEID